MLHTKCFYGIPSYPVDNFTGPATMPRPHLQACMLGNAVHCEMADRINVDKLSVEDLKAKPSF